MIRGSCLCGQVAYEISGELGDIIHCHCTTCRKAHGTAFSSVAAVQIEDFKFASGEDLLKSYESSPGKKRFFCSNCGSQIYAHREGQKHCIFRLGTLDDDPVVRPVKHIWVSLKAPWYEIESDCKLPQVEQWPDDR
jgi:hypothetical protein